MVAVAIVLHPVILAGKFTVRVNLPVRESRIGILGSCRQRDVPQPPAFIPVPHRQFLPNPVIGSVGQAGAGLDNLALLVDPVEVILPSPPKGCVQGRCERRAFVDVRDFRAGVIAQGIFVLIQEGAAVPAEVSCGCPRFPPGISGQRISMWASFRGDNTRSGMVPS